MSESLIIFSRYPEAGKTKTRMIPALGAKGAADLQRRLSEHTLKQARKLRQFRSIDIVIYFAGGNINLMRQWLGNDVSYCVQAEGDLGVKMQSAMKDLFARKKQRVVIIGIDCPSINTAILETAFESLKNHDLVLGEAEDGGYYLIGLSKLVAEMFVGINWGSDRVFADSCAIARSLDLTTAYLPILRDLDRPEDLDLIKLIEN